MSSTITKEDLQQLATSVDASIARLDSKLDASVGRLDASIAGLTDAVHKNGVLLERLTDNVQLAFEGITNTQEQFQRSMLAMEQRLADRITLLEEVVKDHSGHVNGLTTEVAGLRSEVADLRHRFDRRDDLEAIERRVTKLEDRLGRR